MNLHQMARLCVDGACNPIAIINGLSQGIQGMDQNQVRGSLDVKIIVGQLSYLLGESAGPQWETLQQWQWEDKQKGESC